MAAGKSAKTQAAESREAVGFPWLEVLLAISVLALVFQLFPGMFWTLLWAVDVRNWSWTVIAAVHVVVIGGLLFSRAWQQRDV